MRRLPARGRALRLAVVTSVIVAAISVGFVLYRDAQADALVGQARARLFAPIDEAPGLDRIQASTAASLLERARDLGHDTDEVRGLLHYAASLEHLTRGDLLLAEGELGSAHRVSGETAALTLLAAALSRARLQLDVADAEARHALELDPESAQARLFAADLASDRGDLDRAMIHLTWLREHAPACGPVLNRVGLVHEARGELDEAARAYEEAARLDRLGADAWINVGRLARVRRDHAAALEAFTTAVDRAPSNEDALLGRGLARAATGDVEGALLDFTRAAELAANDAEPLLALGDLQRDLGRVDDAIATYRMAIDRDDADAASWLKLGNALALAERYEESARAFEAAIRRSDALAPAYNGLGASLMHLERYDEAAQRLERAFALDASDPNPLMNLALMRERQGDREAARAAWQRVLDVAPDSPIAARRLARLEG